MNRDTFVQLFDYCRWANHRVWDCVMHLSDADFNKPLDYSIGPIRDQVIHMMSVERWWLIFLRTGQLDFLPYTDVTDRETIRALWDEVEAHNAAYVAQLDDEQLSRLVHPNHWDEQDAPISVKQALFQILFHSMDHRAQTLAMLHTLGAPTVGQDLLNYLQDPRLESQK